MAASSLLALIDDISALLDDVAVLTKAAASKTSAVMGDDLALNAEQVAGVRVDRELPVVWAVAKGSFINKLILVPAALLISAFVPKAIMPLMMIGGLFLCYEGFEKVAHKLLHRDDESKERTERIKVIADPAIDLVAFEKAKVKGAVRTDFILSAEIIVISLGTMATAPLGQQVVVLSAIGVGATVLVYGLVAGIVKLDDLGMAMHRHQGDDSGDRLRRKVGAGILRTAPILMKSLSVLGTAAMFTVGGSILVHGFHPLEHHAEDFVALVSPSGGVVGTIARTLFDAFVGIVSGGLVVGIVTMGRKLFGKKELVAA